MTRDTATPVQHISSKDNALVKAVRALAQDNTAYRKWGKVWLEGDHLCRAAMARGWVAEQAVFSESAWARRTDEWLSAAAQISVLPDAMLANLSSLESAQSMGFVMRLPAAPVLDLSAPSVILDRVQDAGNVGSILRSASAFGFKQIVALKGTAALWSSKVLRAGMGAHFNLTLLEGLTPQDIQNFSVPILATSSHQGHFLQDCHGALALPWPCAWALGHEGQGVCPPVAELAQQWVRIAQPGGEESLNVAAAAAICLHASAATSA